MNIKIDLTELILRGFERVSLYKDACCYFKNFYKKKIMKVNKIQDVL